ncbi:hypothetical protein ACLB2K_039433 [Fragaria x ananassa]
MTWQARSASTPDLNVISRPLFPLPLVLFPGAILPLQIFEFRYRMMMHSLLQTDLRFGVIYSDAVSGTADVGCVGEVVKHERLVDDRFFLICKGQERHVSHNQRLMTWQARSASTPDLNVISRPLFPLPLVLFPGAILPLQIFEFRYRMMMHSLLQTDLRFGVIYSDAVSGTADVGCVGEVVKHERLVDDRFFLICKGQERHVSHNQRLMTWQARSASTPDLNVISRPLFPLPLVLFPGAILPLQIFEFRYRMMMHSLLQTDLRFGVIYSDAVSGTADVGCVGEVVKHERLVDDRFFLICKGQERDAVSGTADVGCVGEVVKHERLVDDRFFLICKGQERFRVTDLVRTKPYLVAEVQWLEDRPSGDGEEDLDALATEVESYMKDVIRLSNRLGGKPEKEGGDDVEGKVGVDPRRSGGRRGSVFFLFFFWSKMVLHFFMVENGSSFLVHLGVG